MNMLKTSLHTKSSTGKRKMELTKKFRVAAKVWQQVEQYAEEHGITPTAATREGLRLLLTKKRGNNNASH